MPKAARFLRRIAPISLLLAGLVRLDAAQTPPLAATLDRYLNGEFDAVLADVAKLKHFDDLLRRVETEGPGWIDAGPPADRDRRELAAATFALEAARVAAATLPSSVVSPVWTNLPTGAEVPANLTAPGFPNLLDPALRDSSAPPLIEWKSPALLIEWGCARLRAHATPLALERIWQFAAVATAERAGMVEFLIGSPGAERGNADKEIAHLAHVVARFPAEPRFPLAQAVALEIASWPQGFRLPRYMTMGGPLVDGLTRMTTDDAIGAEASVRLGLQWFRRREPDKALIQFDRAETMTRDPFVVYLARYFRGLVLESTNKLTDAERAYRRALAAVPRAQSATAALAAILVATERVNEATALVEASLTAPVVADPWREYEAADDRFWPELIGRLHAAVAAPAGARR